MATPWYQDGLRFACQRSGVCCTGEPGLVWLAEDEAERLAGRLGLDGPAFRRRYTLTAWKDGVARLVLRDRPGKRGHECMLWDGQGCSLYQDRPRQCRTWPFWRRLVASPQAWAEAALECPGIGQGPLHAAHTITTIAADDGLPGKGV